MSQPTYESLMETIQQLTQELYIIDDQLQALEVEGMNQQHPWQYLVLQRQVDRLVKKQQRLQNVWNRKMTQWAICRSNQPSLHTLQSSHSQQKSSKPISLPDEEEKPASQATALVQAAMQAWEEHDVNALASYLSDNVLCKQLLPQPADKAEVLTLMQAITQAFPDWSFNGHVLDTERLTKQRWRVLSITEVTGTQTGDLVLPSLPRIPATGKRIHLPYRHLEWLIVGDHITAITADFSPSGLEEVLAQLGLELP